jgi:hypothetical protein
MALAPLSNKTLVRDLVSEIAPPAERFVAPPSPAPLAGQAGKQSSPGGGNPSK